MLIIIGRCGEKKSGYHKMVSVHGSIKVTFFAGR